MNKFLLPFFLLINYLSLSQDLNYVWLTKIGDPIPNKGVIPTELVIDQHNNKYMCGRYLGTHDFDPGPGVYQMISQSSTSYSTIYIVKLDSLNNFVWANSYGTTGSTIWNYGLTVDSTGSVYTYGYHEGSLFYDPQNSMNSVAPFWWYSDAYVHKLDPNGNFEWIKSWGHNNEDGIYKMIIDEEQNFYLTGFYTDSTDVDAGPSTYTLNSSSSGTKNYLSKYDSDFNFLWAKQYQGTGNAHFPSLSLNSNDELTLTGNYNGILDFDMNAGVDIDTAYSYNEDMYTHVMDRNGNHKWHHTIKGPGVQDNEICVQDSERNRYVLGTFMSTFDFIPEDSSGLIEFQAQPSNYKDSYIMKLDSLGNQVWTKAIQGMGSYEVNGMVMESDQLIIHGRLNYKTDLDPNSGFLLVQPPFMVNSLQYIEKLDSSGSILWHEELIGSNALQIVDFDFDTEGNYYTFGQISGTADMDPGPNTAQLSHDPGAASFIAIYGEASCAQLGTHFSDPINATCSTSGSANASGVYGTPPYNFTWLTNPPQNTPNLITDTCGLFFIEVIDGNGCADTNSVYINGPVSNSPIDLDVNLITSTFVQGQPATLWLDASNGGCQTTTGSIQLILDTLVVFDSCSVAPTSILGDTLIWDLNFGNSDSAHFTAIVYLTTSQLAITGDTVCLNVQANPFLGDADTLNNLKQYFEPILASYDPNDKKVFPKGICNDHVYMGQALTYTVRFQNTGNSEAIHVNIIDTLDYNLDPSTLKIISQSHPTLNVNYMGNRELQFNFQNIHLPDSLSDPIGSNGYVIFNIEPKEGIAVNTTVSNEVYIFFDFNSPILTNTATTTFTDDIPCIHTDDAGTDLIEALNFEIFPNPTDGEFTIYSLEEKQHQLKVCASTGVLMLTKEINNGEVISLKHLPNGLYFLNLDGYKTERIIIQ